MNAWVTLLTQPGYLPGARALGASLRAAGSAFPLVVMVTDAVDAATRQQLERDGCLLREVEPVTPRSDLPGSYANARFAAVWTKLAAWGLTEFDRVVVLDADMLVTQDMDELMTIDLADGEIAACHACRCNPDRIASYPASWTPEHCSYTHGRGAVMTGARAAADDYLNGGLLVLRPDRATFEALVAEVGALGDLSRYPFAEQDYLNERYAQRWRPLPYVYNALKTLPFQHPALWDASAVKNIHFIIDKPWEKDPDPADPYYELDQLWRAVAR